jgi:hypothetical protein
MPVRHQGFAVWACAGALPALASEAPVAPLLFK